MQKNKRIIRQNTDTVEIVLSVRRVTKVVKGGEKFSFSVLVAVGDKKGRIGFACAKDREVTEAKNKAIKLAMKSFVFIPLRSGKFIYHDSFGSYGASNVVLRSSRSGTGIIAGKVVSAVCECLGVQDIVSKAIGSTNPYNLVRATIKAFQISSSPRSIAERRNMALGLLLSHRAS